MKRVFVALLIFLLVVNSLLPQNYHELEHRKNQFGYHTPEFDGRDWQTMSDNEKFWYIRGYLMAYYVWIHAIHSNQEDPISVYNYVGALGSENEWNLFELTNQYYSKLENINVPLIQGIFHASPETDIPLHQR